MESGDTDGNVGLFSISDSYVRKGTMLSAQLLDGRIFGHIPDGTQERRLDIAHKSRVHHPAALVQDIASGADMIATEDDGSAVESCGHHLASCPRSGRVKKRATPTEHTVARIFREAEATVRKNVFVKDMNVEVGAEDTRQIDILAQDLLCAQLAVDVTLRWARPTRKQTQMVRVLLKARADKEMTHLEVATSGRSKLVIMAIETGGRWSDEAADDPIVVLRESKRGAFARVGSWCGSAGGRACHLPWCERVVRHLCWPICSSRTP